MDSDYSDIKQLTRPRYDDLPPMSMPCRAAQFSPFAALVGYGAAVDETARLTDLRAELTEDETDELNSELDRLIGMLGTQPKVRVTYFVPDARKAGGSYAAKSGTVRIYDSYSNEFEFTDRVRIAVADMCSVEILDSGSDIKS